MTAPVAGWDFRGFTREFKLFGDFLLAFGEIAEKYCRPDGTCTDLFAAGRATNAMMDRWSVEELRTLRTFIVGFQRVAAPQLLDLLTRKLEARGG